MNEKNYDGEKRRGGLKEKLVETLIFPENSSLIVRIVLFPYSYLCINSLNWIISGLKEKDLYNLLTGSLYVFITWGGFFGLFGVFFSASLGFDPNKKDSIGEQIVLIFFLLGFLMAFIVGRVRFRAYSN